MARSIYGRDKFEGLRYFDTAGIIFAGFFFTLAHAVGRYYVPKSTSKKLLQLKNSILLANLVVLMGLVPLWIVYSHVSTDDNLTTCRSIHICGLVLYTIINFCLYRVLLFKSQAYDSMKEYRSTYKYVFWTVHVISPCLVVGVTFLSSIADYEILTDDLRGGNRLCVITGYSLLPFTASGSFALTLFSAIVDLLVSILCGLLLVLPIFKPGFTATGNTGVVRNIFFSSIAIISTFTTLVTFAVLEKKEGFWTIGFVMDIGGADLLINVSAVNLCWPVAFYVKQMRRIAHGASGVSVGFSLSRKSRRSVERSHVLSKAMRKEFTIKQTNENSYVTPSFTGKTIDERTSTPLTPRKSIESKYKAGDCFRGVTIEPTNYKFSITRPATGEISVSPVARRSSRVRPPAKSPENSSLPATFGITRPTTGEISVSPVARRSSRVRSPATSPENSSLPATFGS